MTYVVLPSLSAGMEDGVIARWLKVEGDAIRKGEILAEIETDKATMELEAEQDGKLGRIAVAAGQRAAVNQVIAVILADGEKLAEPVPEASARQPAEQAIAIASVMSPPASARALASPLARRLAQEGGIELANVTGSGPKGRIVRIDVERLKSIAPSPIALAEVSSPQVAAPEAVVIPANIGLHDEIPHSGMRKVIARRLLEAKTTIPHFYLSLDCELDALLALRAQVNADRQPEQRISVNDFVVKAAATALAAVPEANVVWTENALIRLHAVDISVAVATEGGLFTPVVRNVDRKSIGAISAEIRSLAARARDNRLKPEEYQGGGFSVSNLGMYGVRSFSAIINPPQSCILAVGAAERRPIMRGEEMVPATMMNCTLSVDHRSVDGALGARLLAAIKSSIEQPLRLLV